MEKKQQYGCECYKNISENEKQKLVGYRKKYYSIIKHTGDFHLDIYICFRYFCTLTFFFLNALEKLTSK